MAVDPLRLVKTGQNRHGTVFNSLLSADHRVVFGADAVRFMQTLANYCEQPGDL